MTEEREIARNRLSSFLKSFLVLAIKFFFYGVISLIPILIVFWLFSLFWGEQIVSLREIMGFFLGRVFPQIEITDWMMGITLFLIIIGIGILSPLVSKRIYPWVGNLIQKLLRGKISEQYRGVVAFEYFKEGIWVVGIVTGCIKGSEYLKKGRILKIFVPSVPIPVTGLAPLFMQEKDVIYIDLPVNEMVRTYTSGGILAPERIPELVAELEKREGISGKDK